MNIIIFGYTGMLGKALINFWQDKHTIIGISRKPISYMQVQTSQWNQLGNIFNTKKIDVVINLCGESIGQPWHKWSKKRIYDSRVKTTQKIVKAMNQQSIHFINAGGIGIYPNSKTLNHKHFSESSKLVNDGGFLQSLAFDWEKAAMVHKNTTILRTAVIMKKNDGVLQKLMMGHQLKLLTQLGCGSNPFPWIAISDWCRAVDFIVDRRLLGEINLTSPELTSYNEIMDTLCRKVNAYKIILPNMFVRGLLGEMGTSLFLTGSAAIPSKLLKEGFKFNYTNFSNIEI